MKHVLGSARKRLVAEGVGLLALAPLVAALWLVWLGTPLRFLSIDLYPTYVAGSLWSQGEWDAIYQRAVFFDSYSGHPRWQQEVERVGARNFGSSFVYNPVYLWLMLPVIGALSLTRFVAFFLLLNALSAVVLGSEALRLAGVARLRWRLLGGLAAALTFPAVYGAGLGQNVLPAAALLLLGFRALEAGGRMQIAAVSLLLLAVAFKTWLVAALPLLLLAGWWRPFLGGAAGYGLLFVLLPRLAAPGFAAMYQETAARLPSLSVVAHNNVSLRAALHRAAWPGWGADVSRWYPTSAPSVVQVAEAASLAVLGLAFLALWWWRRPGPRVLLAAGLALLVPCLGISWSHYLVLLVPAAALGLLGPGHAAATRALCAALLLLLFVPLHPLAMRPLPTPEAVAAAPRLWAAWYAIPPLAAIATAFALMAEPAYATRRRKISNETHASA